MANTKTDTLCCPRFDPEPWNEKELLWKDKLFVKDTVMQFMHSPLPGTFSKTVGRMWKKIEEAGANPDIKDFIMLATESSPWRGEIYINATKEVPNAENVKLSGTYVTKVFDGSYNEIPKWVKEMSQYVNQKGKTIKKYYFYYTTCPKCAKVYGHNYIVAFAEV
ncbi:MAG: hydrolase [Chloroflexota bacterium]